MAQEKNPILKVIVPLVLFAGAIGLGWAVLQNTSKQRSVPPSITAEASKPAAQGTPAGATPAATPGTPTAGTPATPGNPAPGSPPALTAAAPGLKGLKAQPWPKGTPQPSTQLGAALPPPPRGTKGLVVTFSPLGAGIESIVMADDTVSVAPGSPHTIVQEAARISSGSGTRTMVPYALLGLTIDGTVVNLTASAEGPLWKETAPGAFEATIVDEGGTPVGRVKRSFTLAPESHDLIVDQSFENLTKQQLTVQWFQMGPVDPPSDAPSAQEVRRVHMGYISPGTIDPEQATVVGDTGFLKERPLVLGETAWNGKAGSAGSFEYRDLPLWPDPDGSSKGLSLSWVAATNRYFASAVHAVPSRTPARTDTPSGKASEKRLVCAAGGVDRLAISTPSTDRSIVATNARFGIRMTSALAAVPAGETQSQVFGIYAGPKSRKFAESDADLRAVSMGDLVVYGIGGRTSLFNPLTWCGLCMFQPVASTFHWYLTILHDYVFHDWSLGIAFLVITLRTLLHPMTTWTQRSMITMGKRMAALAPKQKKLQERYGNDPAKLREEQAKLMQEEGVGPTSMLGCAPMFLQMLVNTPLWIGLSAAISAAYELRHEPALFGLFQKVGSLLGGFWPFVADLSNHDRFIPLPWNVPLGFLGTVDSINILPLFLGLVFFFQQKYLTPPPTTQLTPEQEQQQKIMKVMMVVMFPVMMYNQPAALVLYFTVNSALGSIEAAHIRKQFEKKLAADEAAQKLAGPSVIDRKNKPQKTPGFFDRIRQQIELAQQLKEQQAKEKKRKR